MPALIPNLEYRLPEVFDFVRALARQIDAGEL